MRKVSYFKTRSSAENRDILNSIISLLFFKGMSEGEKNTKFHLKVLI